MVKVISIHSMLFAALAVESNVNVFPKMLMVESKMEFCILKRMAYEIEGFVNVFSEMFNGAALM